MISESLQPLTEQYPSSINGQFYFRNNCCVPIQPLISIADDLFQFWDICSDMIFEYHKWDMAFESFWTSKKEVLGSLSVPSQTSVSTTFFSQRPQISLSYKSYLKCRSTECVCTYIKPILFGASKYVWFNDRQLQIWLWYISCFLDELDCRQELLYFSSVVFGVCPGGRRTGEILWWWSSSGRTHRKCSSHGKFITATRLFKCGIKFYPIFYKNHLRLKLCWIKCYPIIFTRITLKLNVKLNVT